MSGPEFVERRGRTVAVFRDEGRQAEWKPGEAARWCVGALVVLAGGQPEWW